MRHRSPASADGTTVSAGDPRRRRPVGRHARGRRRRARPVRPGDGRAPALFRDGSFDLVVSTASCRHWDNPFAALHEIGRVLAPGATLCIADLFDPRRRGFPKLQRGAGLLATLVATLADAGLVVRQTQVVPGFGLVPSITVLVAERPPATPSSGEPAQPTASGLSAGPRVPLSAPVRVSPLLL
jgi:SAM-dependent methyltransferase